jgi:squalene-hopene/tetraprenyl-beta-curcumene cyclase
MRLTTLVLIAAAASGSAGHLVPPAAAAAPPDDDYQLAQMAISRGRAWLLDHQQKDGVWRSDVYSAFRDGTSLTPLVLLALRESAPPAGEDEFLSRGRDQLAAMVRPDGSIDPGRDGINYPVYTAALAVRVLSGSPKHKSARDTWLAELRRRQLDEANGWSPNDPAYGGWGYCHALPLKPKTGEFVPPLLESNLSATVYALDALHAAGVPADDPAYRKALSFVVHCQNWREDKRTASDDGGFFFIDGDAARNKAGPVSNDVNGRERFRSYGSTTADGYRVLRLCGLPADHPRVVAARDWLRKNFDGATHAGDYPRERAADKDAVYFYYAWSMSQILDDIAPADAKAWATGLTKGIIGRQHENGSWSNPCKAVREDDPILATAFAVGALAHCQRQFR